MPSLSAKNLGFIFDSTLFFSKQISSFFRACHYHIHNFRCIRHTLDFTAVTTIGTALVHSCLDYCNSHYHSLPITQIKPLQHIQNGLACAVTRTPKHLYISPVRQSFHRLKVEQRIQYKIISITCNLLHITEPKAHKYQTSQQNWYSDYLCLSLPPVSTRLKFADRSFRNSSPRLWNSLPINLKSFASDTHHYTTVINSTPSHPCKAFSFFRALKPTSSLFPTILNLPALPSFPAPFPTGSFSQYSSRTNGNKHLRIHHHFRVLVSRGLYKALLYFSYLLSLN